MKTSMRVGMVAAALAAVAGLAVAGAAGYARTFTLPASGALSIVNAQRHDVWRPCAVAIVCPSVAERTVTVYRVAGALEYPLVQNTATARSYVYEFQANYWSALSNGLRVTVSPACTGTVEVVYE